MTLQDLYDQPKSDYFSAYDSSFVAGDSPVTLDVKGTLGRLAIAGYVQCDGSGDILFAISSDGTNFGSNIPIKNGDEFNLHALNVNKIKITHSGTDSSYRVYCE